MATTITFLNTEYIYIYILLGFCRMTVAATTAAIVIVVVAVVVMAVAVDCSQYVTELSYFVAL